MAPGACGNTTTPFGGQHEGSRPGQHATMTSLSSPFAIARLRAPWLAIERAGENLADLGGVLASSIWFAIVFLAVPFGRAWRTGQEAFCYWIANLHSPYSLSDWGSPIAYVYSPAFIQAVAPLTWLPWLLFMAIWTALLIAAVRFLTGRRLFAIGMLLATLELAGGNIHLLLAVAIVLGFRWPATWSFVLLTKVTPGIGLLWFVVRREWRQLGIALGATALITAASATIMPQAWLDWFNLLSGLAGHDGGTWAAVPIPFLVRLPIGVAIVVWGARTDRRWTVPVAAMLALPALWYGGLTMLLAVIALRDPEREPGGQPVSRRAPAQGAGAAA
jgi:hypothetical protein